jgi:hypothetical protein
MESGKIRPFLGVLGVMTLDWRNVSYEPMDELHRPIAKGVQPGVHFLSTYFRMDNNE